MSECKTTLSCPLIKEESKLIVWTCHEFNWTHFLLAISMQLMAFGECTARKASADCFLDAALQRPERFSWPSGSSRSTTKSRRWCLKAATLKTTSRRILPLQVSQELSPRHLLSHSTCWKLAPWMPSLASSMESGTSSDTQRSSAHSASSRDTCQLSFAWPLKQFSPSSSLSSWEWISACCRVIKSKSSLSNTIERFCCLNSLFFALVVVFRNA